jgi:tetratricopeptide (TPR) repeat protein
LPTRRSQRQSAANLQAVANVRYNDGAFAEAERLQREAIALSPRNPETLAQLGWRLMARGRLDEALDILREAVARSWRSPTWYHQPLALAHYFRGELQPAYDEAVIGQGFCCGLGNATLAITAAGLGRRDEAKAALNRALAEAPQLGRDPRQFWRAFRCQEELIDRLVAGLREAGLIVAVSEPMTMPVTR